MAGRGVERSAVGILDARIVIERSLLGAAGIADALFARKRVNVGIIKIEIAGQGAELRGVGDSGEGIFRSDFRKLNGGLDHAIQSFAGKVAGIGAGGALSVEYTDADGFRAGLLQSLDLAEANERGEFVALADDALGGRRT